MNEAIELHCELFSKKNSKRILFNRKTRKPFVAQSENSSRSSNAIAILLRDAKIRKAWFAMIAGVPVPYRLNIKIYRSTKRRFDYVNIVQGLLDVMVKLKYLPDDSADIVIPVFHPFEVDKLHPRVRLWIEK